MKYRFLFLIMLVFFISAQGQDEIWSAKSLSLGYTSQTDVSVFSAFYNQALLSELEGINMGLCYQNFLLLPGYDAKALAVALGLKNYRTLALDLSMIGIPGFSNQKLGLAYGMRLSNNLSAGIQLNLHVLNQPDYYGDIYTATSELSLAYRYGENLTVGVRVFNLWYGLLRSESLPIIIDGGLSYRFSDKALLLAEVEKNIFSPYSLKWGAQYTFGENFDLRIGGKLQGMYYTYTLGLGYKLHNFTADLGFASHPVTGMSAGISLIANF